jgi:hypothetical protein
MRRNTTGEKTMTIASGSTNAWGFVHELADKTCFHTDPRLFLQVLYFLCQIRARLTGIKMIRRCFPIQFKEAKDLYEEFAEGCGHLDPSTFEANFDRWLQDWNANMVELLIEHIARQEAEVA